MSISVKNSLVFHGGGVVFHWHNGVACDEWLDSLGYRVAVNAHKSHTKDRLVADEVFNTLEEAYSYIDNNR